MKILRFAVVILPFLLVSCSVTKQTAVPISTAGKDAYSAYIARYSDMAVDQMKQYGIPASITLAQGLLESDAGRSTLASKCNNHFGIKCHNDWKGRKMYHDDDERQECFRCYGSPEDSYRDHSLFLVNGARYKDLFKLGATDYKGWAKGLKAAGYATSPTYAQKLIELIERYGLDHYDTRNGVRLKPGQLPHQPLLVNGQRCVRLREGETLKDIAREYGMQLRLLRRFNEVDRKFTPPVGTLIYLERKKSRADREHRTYVVRKGDSLWSISQQFGVRMNSLASRNRLGDDNPLTVGMTLVLR
ncbi:MAG: glucosaminidase domain-containing protein [Bacteroidaceae bacterium]|nr:glucosaminidase domain-containing protein [Bacteroidaceae bacterium]